MDRLTYDFVVGNKHCWQVKGADNLLCNEVCKAQGDNGCAECPIAKAFDRLAAYEDTGLEPEEYKKQAEALKKLDIEHMHNLLQAENDGRLIVLPCKVGDTVWTNFAVSSWRFRDEDKPYLAKVVFVGLNDSDDIGRGVISVEYGEHGHMMQFQLSDIGKIVFLTREEAEAELKN